MSAAGPGPQGRRRLLLATANAHKVDEVQSILGGPWLVVARDPAVEETGLGRYEDKLSKNKLIVDKTPGMEILRPQAYTGDDGLMLTERAPYGVILAVTPTTNPTETIICNSIGMVAGGNTITFNTHPGAKKISARTVSLVQKRCASSCVNPRARISP